MSPEIKVVEINRLKAGFLEWEKEPVIQEPVLTAVGGGECFTRKW